MKNLTRIFFYGNIFYGLCTVALCIETNLRLGIALNNIRFYILIFLATIVYYSRIYYRSSKHINPDDRSNWYRENRAAIKAALIICGIVITAILLLILYKKRNSLGLLDASNLLLLLLFPLFGVMYSFRIFRVRKLRHFGWLKPFIIGLVWSGVVTVFPLVLWQLNYGQKLKQTVLPTGFLWLQNFLFISILAIVFDIKDCNSDRKLRLNTYPALWGINNTICYFIVPLTLLCLACLAVFNYWYGIPLLLTIVQSIPCLVLLIMSKSLSKQRHLLFYLAAIDGLMFLKAVAGITSILFFKN